MCAYFLWEFPWLPFFEVQLSDAWTCLKVYSIHWIDLQDCWLQSLLFSDFAGISLIFRTCIDNPYWKNVLFSFRLFLYFIHWTNSNDNIRVCFGFDFFFFDSVCFLLETIVFVCESSDAIVHICVLVSMQSLVRVLCFRFVENIGQFSDHILRKQSVKKRKNRFYLFYCVLYSSE